MILDRIFILMILDRIVGFGMGVGCFGLDFDELVIVEWTLLILLVLEWISMILDRALIILGRTLLILLIWDRMLAVWEFGDFDYVG